MQHGGTGTDKHQGILRSGLSCRQGRGAGAGETSHWRWLLAAIICDNCHMQGEESVRHRRATKDFTEDEIAVDAKVETFAVGIAQPLLAFGPGNGSDVIDVVIRLAASRTDGKDRWPGKREGGPRGARPDGARCGAVH